MGLRMRPPGSPDSGGETQQVNCPRCDETIEAPKAAMRVRCPGCGSEVAVKRLQMPAMPIDPGGEEIVRLHEVVGRGPRPPREQVHGERPRVPPLAPTRSEAPRPGPTRAAAPVATRDRRETPAKPREEVTGSDGCGVQGNRRWTWAVLALLVLAVIIGYLFTRTRWN